MYRLILMSADVDGNNDASFYNWYWRETNEEYPLLSECCQLVEKNVQYTLAKYAAENGAKMSSIKTKNIERNIFK